MTQLRAAASARGGHDAGLSWLAVLLGTAAGFGLALAGVSPWWRLRIVALACTEFRRSIPILIIMFFAYFGLPVFLGGTSRYSPPQPSPCTPVRLCRR